MAMDEESKTPVMMLREKGGKRVLPVWIGIFEAASILYAAEGVEPPRPMSHDLMKIIVDDLGAVVDRVDIGEGGEGAYHANIHLLTGEGRRRLIDARPSDAVALAVRTGARLFVAEAILREESEVVFRDNSDLSEDEFWKDYLENLDPSAFGKYKM